MDTKARDLVLRALAYEPPFIPVDNNNRFCSCLPWISREYIPPANPSPANAKLQNLVDKQDISFLQYRTAKTPFLPTALLQQTSSSTVVGLDHVDSAPAPPVGVVFQPSSCAKNVTDMATAKLSRIHSDLTALFYQLHKFSAASSAYSLVRAMSGQEQAAFITETELPSQLLFSALDAGLQVFTTSSSGITSSTDASIREYHRTVYLIQLAITLSYAATAQTQSRGGVHTKTWLTSGRFHSIILFFSSALGHCFGSVGHNMAWNELLTDIVSALRLISKWHSMFGVEAFLRDDFTALLISLLGQSWSSKSSSIVQSTFDESQVAAVDLLASLTVLLQDDDDDVKRLVYDSLNIYHSQEYTPVRSYRGMLPTSALFMRLMEATCAKEGALCPYETLFNSSYSLGRVIVEELMREAFDDTVSKQQNTFRSVLRMTIEDFSAKLLDPKWPSSVVLCYLCYSGLKLSLSQRKLHNDLTVQSLREILTATLNAGIRKPLFNGTTTVQAMDRVLVATKSKFLWVYFSKALAEHNLENALASFTDEPQSSTVVSADDYHQALLALSVAQVYDDALMGIRRIMSDDIKLTKSMKGAMTALFVQIANLDPSITTTYIDVTWHASRSDSQSVRREVPKLLALMIDDTNNTREIVQILCHLSRDSFPTVSKSARITLARLFDRITDPSLLGEVIATLIMVGDPDVGSRLTVYYQDSQQASSTSLYRDKDTIDNSIKLLTTTWAILDKHNDGAKLINHLAAIDTDFVAKCVAKLSATVIDKCSDNSNSLLGTLAACVVAQPQSLKFDNFMALVVCGYKLNSPHVLQIYARELCLKTPNDRLRSTMASTLWGMLKLKLDRHALVMTANCLALLFRQEPDTLVNIFSKLTLKIDSDISSTDNDDRANSLDSVSVSRSLVLIAQVMRMTNNPAHLPWAKHVSFNRRFTFDECAKVAETALKLIKKYPQLSDLRSAASDVLAKICTITPVETGPLLQDALTEIRDGSNAEKISLVNVLNDLLDDTQAKTTSRDGQTSAGDEFQHSMSTEVLALHETNRHSKFLFEYALSTDFELSRTAIEFLIKALTLKALMPGQTLPVFLALTVCPVGSISSDASNTLNSVMAQHETPMHVAEGVKLAVKYLKSISPNTNATDTWFQPMYDHIKDVFKTPRKRSAVLVAIAKLMDLSPSEISDGMVDMAKYIVTAFANTLFLSGREVSEVYNCISLQLASASWEAYEEESFQHRAIDILVIWLQLLRYLRRTYKWSGDNLDGPIKKLRSETRFDLQLSGSFEDKRDLLEEGSDDDWSDSSEGPRKRARLAI